MKIFISLLLSFIFVVGCATQKQSEKDNENSKNDVYVFDQIGNKVNSNDKTATIDSAKVANVDSTLQVDEKVDAVNKVEETNESPEPVKTIETPKLYFVQLGAFTTQERAEEFINQAKELLDTKTFTITFNDEKELFLVQLPPYKDKKEAEKVRNRLWKYKMFKDAFIVEQ